MYVRLGGNKRSRNYRN